MCGINGMFHFSGGFFNSSAELMRDSQSHRGPDDFGSFSDSFVELGHRRLSILDLTSNGRQPMVDSTERYRIVFNGEIFNFHELRSTLVSQGLSFHTSTDTEVLLTLYREKGPEMLHMLNGMFAFAVYDVLNNTIFIARDRVGVKPLVYANHKGTFFFASEHKALFSAGVPRIMRDDLWHELLYFRYIAGDNTPFEGVKRLLPGHYLEIKDSIIKVKRWWNLGDLAQNSKTKNFNESQAQDWFRDTFDSAVSLRTISDVPVGVLLSGGLDSSSVAASLALQNQGVLESFTVSFAEQEFNEGPLAQEVANSYGMTYNGLLVKDQDVFNLLIQSAWYNDEPLVHQNDLFVLAISRLAKNKVTVLLSGEGGDELLGGYVRYKPADYPFMLKALYGGASGVLRLLPSKGRWNKLARFTSLPGIDYFKMFNSCSYLPKDFEVLDVKPRFDFSYRQTILDEAKLIYPKNIKRQIMYYDQHIFLGSILDRNDRMTMGASIECRTPFLDYRLLEGLAGLTDKALFPGKESKSLLRQSVGMRLPANLMTHRKMGFPVPWRNYITSNQELKNYIHVLSSHEVIQKSPINQAKLSEIIKAFEKGDDKYQLLVRQLLMLALWYDVTFTTKFTNILPSYKVNNKA